MDNTLLVCLDATEYAITSYEITLKYTGSETEPITARDLKYVTRDTVKTYTLARNAILNLDRVYKDLHTRWGCFYVLDAVKGSPQTYVLSLVHVNPTDDVLRSLRNGKLNHLTFVRFMGNWLLTGLLDNNNVTNGLLETEDLHTEYAAGFYGQTLTTPDHEFPHHGSINTDAPLLSGTTNVNNIEGVPFLALNDSDDRGPRTPSCEHITTLYWDLVERYTNAQRYPASVWKNALQPCSMSPDLGDYDRVPFSRLYPIGGKSPMWVHALPLRRRLLARSLTLVNLKLQYALQEFLHSTYYPDQDERNDDVLADSVERSLTALWTDWKACAQGPGATRDSTMLGFTHDCHVLASSIALAIVKLRLEKSNNDRRTSTTITLGLEAFSQGITIASINSNNLKTLTATFEFALCAASADNIYYSLKGGSPHAKI
ncbi:hypothetical protein [Vibrio sonorensis]|uniref:hypothetical protein n=1 Tax=Vibrio sonorensis TaxID=1004316 RepID=UPI0008DA4ED8|nr:hypothetical protein [Vibrio sonorensis]